jgi:nitrogenase molybdenum-iron protein NifN
VKTDAKPVTNPCDLCAPLGASVAFKGVARSVAILHGSQGCATYIRRYLISHYREPVDIASSSFDEESVIFGGRDNLVKALENVAEKYSPEVIGIATTCLTETIGDDVPLFIREFERDHPGFPPIVTVSTASYRMTHTGGFKAALFALVRRFAPSGTALSPSGIWPGKINLFAGMVSPEDIRYLKELAEDFRLPLDVLPDYSETLDGEVWGEYKPLPDGGTGIERFKGAAAARATIEFFHSSPEEDSPGRWLERTFDTPLYPLPLPLGIEATDRFLAVLSELAGYPGGAIPEKLKRERGRLVDAYIDGHKYLFGIKVTIAAREELAEALVLFCRELGMEPVLCAVSGRSASLAGRLSGVTVLDDTDHDEIGRLASETGTELLIGSGKLYRIARDRKIPLIRCDFPIHDRFGGQRICTVGWRGTIALLDRIINTILERRQEESSVGYTYL